MPGFSFLLLFLNFLKFLLNLPSGICVIFQRYFAKQVEIATKISWTSQYARDRPPPPTVSPDPPAGPGQPGPWSGAALAPPPRSCNPLWSSESASVLEALKQVVLPPASSRAPPGVLPTLLLLPCGRFTVKPGLVLPAGSLTRGLWFENDSFGVDLPVPLGQQTLLLDPLGVPKSPAWLHRWLARASPSAPALPPGFCQALVPPCEAGGAVSASGRCILGL